MGSTRALKQPLSHFLVSDPGLGFLSHPCIFPVNFFSIFVNYNVIWNLFSLLATKRVLRREGLTAGHTVQVTT